MKFTLECGDPVAVRTDLLVVPAGKQWRAGAAAAIDTRTRGALGSELHHHGFSGAEDDVVLLQTLGALPARYVLVVGTGGSNGPRPWYRVAHAALTRGRELKARRIAMAPDADGHLPLDTVAEGVRLSAYAFDRFKTVRKRPPVRVGEVVCLVPKRDARARAALARGETIAAATCYARDLITMPAQTVTPSYLATEAKRLARAQGLTVRVLDARGMRRLGMGAVLGVAQGSAQPPRFIELGYRPAGTPRAQVALAGKGITFDSGGLSLKPAQAMESQKRDMAGAAAVLGVMSVVRDLALPVEVRAYIPSAENMPGGRALKPGDVVTAYNGKTIEVLNTDAEGRLVLADALAYAASTKPDVLIDLATLTAAVRIALGSRYAGIMGTSPTLVQALIRAGQACGENLWELPLVGEYRSDIDSQIADIKNTGDGAAGTIIGGLFLREFVGDVPWAHIDFSSTVMTDKPFACHPRGATGFGVRTLLSYLRTL